MNDHHEYLTRRLLAAGSERWRERQAEQDAGVPPGAPQTPVSTPQDDPAPWEVYRGGCVSWSPLCTAILTGTLVGLGLGGWIAEALRLAGR